AKQKNTELKSANLDLSKEIEASQKKAETLKNLLTQSKKTQQKLTNQLDTINNYLTAVVAKEEQCQKLQFEYKALQKKLLKIQENKAESDKRFDELNKKYLLAQAELRFIRSLIDQYLLAAWGQKAILVSTIYYELGSSWNWQAGEKNKLKLIFSEMNKLNKNDFFVFLRGHSDIAKFLKNHKRCNLNLSLKRASHFSQLLSEAYPKLTIKVCGVSEYESKKRKVEILILPITQINLVDTLVNIKKEIS
ncbi:hypothetical protein K8R32_01470, partial [bacterium]|nr:hypothetical protein [bacterium]